MRIKPMTVAAMCLATLGLNIFAPGSANADTPSAEKFDRIAALSAAGVPPAEVAKQLGLVKVSQDAPRLNQHSFESDTTVSIPVVYYDTDLGTYYAQSTFDWKNTKWMEDLSASGNNVGGPEMFGINVDQAVYYVRSSISVCPTATPTYSGPNPTPYRCTSYTTTYVSNVNGAALRWQDKAQTFSRTVQGPTGPQQQYSGTQYNSDAGTMWFEFGWFRRDVCHQFFSELNHSWKSTSINSVGVNSNGFSVGWTGGAEHWKQSSNGSGKMFCS